MKQFIVKNKMSIGIFLICGMAVVMCSMVAWNIAVRPDEVVRMQLGSDMYVLEVADSAIEQEQGLQHRTALAEGNGMIFTFQKAEAVHFWMKNTLIPLDMVWVKDGVVVSVTPNVQPEIGVPVSQLKQYGPAENQPIDTVIELPAGSAAKSGIMKGVELTPVSK